MSVSTPSSSSSSKILDYLRTLAPYSIVDKGIALAKEGAVQECSRSGGRIIGVVQGGDSSEYPVTLDIVSPKRVGAQCRCSSQQEMEEQWCVHALALLWQANTLGFFEPLGGFAASDSLHRLNTTSPTEIAEVLFDIHRSSSYEPSTEVKPSGQMTIAVSTSSDRFGIRLLVDGVAQEPSIFAGTKIKTGRQLDHLLLELIEDAGDWDDSTRLWYVSSSSAIAQMLGLFLEYEQVEDLATGKALTIAEHPVEAQLEIAWQGTGAELSMHWILPDGTRQKKQEELIGTGPYWVALDATLYRVAASAARIATIFPHSSRVTFARSQLGPVLQFLRDQPDPKFVSIRNPEAQPKTEIKKPTPKLAVRVKDTSGEHFSSQDSVTLYGELQFDYPEPPKKKNLVYLPDQETEQSYRQQLRELGFRFQPERQRYFISGDDALDFIYEKSQALLSPWEVEGVSAARNSFRFAELQLHVDVTEGDEKEQKIPGRIDWFDTQISLLQNKAHIPISTLFKKLGRGGDRWVRLDNGAFAQVPGGGLSRLKNTLGMVDQNFRLSNTIKTRVNTAQAFAFSGLDDDSVLVRMDQKLAVLRDKLNRFQKIKRLNASKNFKGTLREYQEDGLSWLNFLREFSLGGILADEMGLGKTVQALSFIQHLKDHRSAEHKLRGPVLVVAPTSVITNWMYEAKRFCPKLKVLLLHGPERRKAFHEIEKHDIVITSYALLRIDRAELQQFEYDIILLDEAQFIKNPTATTTRAAKSLMARQRIALTGTPTENRPLELWSIFDFLMPSYLGSIDFFRRNVEKPILDGSDEGPAQAEALRKRTSPFILRRLKAEVEKELPEKIESEVHVEMTESQASLYAQVLDEVRPQVLDAIRDRGIRGASVSILAALLRLRQVCNHPNSIEALKDLPGFDSGKYNLFQELIAEALESNRKILVFSQFREMLSLLRRHLDATSVNHLYLDGSTRNRQELIDQFNSDEKIRLFLISLKAGGTGLNLTAADTVIIYDPWWNPAVESQAVDRAHRIGQTKAVTVYRLVTENSIEQKIMKLKEKKTKIVDALLEDGSSSPLRLTKEDIQDLFQVKLGK